MPLITAIIPTLASATRKKSLLVAIQSLLGSVSNKSSLKILVVINGQQYSHDVVESLKKMPIELIFIKEGSLPLAIFEGVSRVQTEFYCFLDDDDEYLPMAIDQRLEKISTDDEVALVTTNGFRRIAGQDSLIMTNLKNVRKAPLEALFDENWLASCGGLYRKSKIGCNYFQYPHRYLEWTWLAYNVSLQNKKVITLDSPTFIVNDTQDSLSKSENYMLAHIELYERMLSLKPPMSIKKIIHNKLTNTLHTVSEYYLNKSQRQKAFKYHIKSLNKIYGLRYLLFSRNFLLPNFYIKKQT